MGDTREKILGEALSLFSIYGTEAVSVRDICSAVGIKESSLYYHFPGKAGISAELYARFNARAAEIMRSLSEALENGERLKKQDVLNVCARFFDEFWMEPFCNRVLRLLTMEQNSSGDARALYRRWCFDEPLALHSRAFAAATGRADSGYLAVKFYSPIFLYAHRWLLCGSLSAGDKAAFRADAYRHIRRFLAELWMR